MICKNAEFVNALDSTWFWIFCSSEFVIGFTGSLRLTGLKDGSCNNVWCFLLQESMRHFAVDAQSLILCPFDRQFQQSCFSLTKFLFSSKFILINVSHAVSLWSFRQYQQIIFKILLLLKWLFLANSGLSPLLFSSFVAKCLR